MGKALDGKVVLVTGAGGGIGRDIALMAAAEGAAVVVNDLGASLKGIGQSVTAAQTVVDEIKAAGGHAIPDGGSVTEPDHARAMVEAAVKEFGRIDAVVNNAGILRDGYFHKMSYEDFDAVVKVNLYGAFNTSRAAVDYFERGRREMPDGLLPDERQGRGGLRPDLRRADERNLSHESVASATLGSFQRRLDGGRDRRARHSRAQVAFHAA